MTQENKFVQKVSWVDVRQHVASLNQSFAQLVDELAPDHSLPLYLVKYPYGSMIADTQCAYLPDTNGHAKPFAEVIAHDKNLAGLAYGKDCLPMTMVLEKQLENFVDLKLNNTTIPWLIYQRGSFFPFATILGREGKHNYSPNGLLTISAGARSTFLLPNIGCVTNHQYLQRDYRIQAKTPKSFYDHWSVMKSIANSKKANNEWHAVVLYFSEKWVQAIQTDKAWLQLKNYFLELAWDQFEFDRNRIYYDIAYSLMLQKRNLKPNPYLTDTARHLFAIASGCAPGFAPAQNDNALPLSLLQKAFAESYQLKKYLPTIMLPRKFKLDASGTPVYYSLQQPSTHMFSPKSRKVSSTLFEMRELEHVMKIFAEELGNNMNVCSDTILNRVAQSVKFHYYHNEVDTQQVINHSSDIEKFDARFTTMNYPHCPGQFAADSKFLRGCVSIS